MQSKYYKHITQQWPVIQTMARALLLSLGKKNKPWPQIPTEIITRRINPLNGRWLDDYVESTGGSVDQYQDSIPFHLFSTWCIPVGFLHADKLPFDFTQIINLGAKVEINGPLARDQPLMISSQIIHVRASKKRCIVTTRFITETALQKNALICDVYTILPRVGQAPLIEIAPGNERETSQKDTSLGRSERKSIIPSTVKLIKTIDLKKDAGLQFAFLTGDFNPLHWLGFYAKKMGFKAPILHGYASLAMTTEALIHCEQHRQKKLKNIEVSFTQPLFLPQTVNVYMDDDDETFFMGSEIGGKTFLSGSCRFEPH